MPIVPPKKLITVNGRTYRAGEEYPGEVKKPETNKPPKKTVKK